MHNQSICENVIILELIIEIWVSSGDDMFVL